VNACAESGLRALETREGASHLPDEFVQIVGAAVGKGALRLGPDLFIRVELRSVRWKSLEVQARKPIRHLSHAIPLVDAGVVPEYDDFATKVTQEMTEEQAHLVVPDVLAVALEVQTDASTGR